MYTCKFGTILKKCQCFPLEKVARYCLRSSDSEDDYEDSDDEVEQDLKEKILDAMDLSYANLPHCRFVYFITSHTNRSRQSKKN